MRRLAALALGTLVLGISAPVANAYPFVLSKQRARVSAFYNTGQVCDQMAECLDYHVVPAYRCTRMSATVIDCAWSFDVSAAIYCYGIARQTLRPSGYVLTSWRGTHCEAGGEIDTDHIRLP